MENRVDVKSGCKGVLLRNSGRNSGVRVLGTHSGRTGSVRTLELNSRRTRGTGRSEGASDASVFFADAWDAGDALLTSGRNADRSDPGSVFADGVMST